MEKTTEKQKNCHQLQNIHENKNENLSPPPKKKGLDVNRLLEQSWLAN